MNHSSIATTHAHLGFHRRLLGILLAVCLLGLMAGTALAQASPDGDDAASTPAVPGPLTVNVNLDDALTLSDLLTGIGPARADAIVEYREANGRFSTPEDLLAVSGIGPATLEGIRGQLEFSAAE